MPKKKKNNNVIHLKNNSEIHVPFNNHFDLNRAYNENMIFDYKKQHFTISTLTTEQDKFGISNITIRLTKR